MNVTLIAIGILAGIASGIFGIGGGIIIVPALIYIAKFSQHLATGTSLAILLPPVGIAAVLEYHRHGNVDIRSALLVAAGVFVGGWFGAMIANKISGPYLRLGFGIFVLGMGVSLMYGAAQKLGWLASVDTPVCNSDTSAQTSGEDLSCDTKGSRGGEGI